MAENSWIGEVNIIFFIKTDYNLRYPASLTTSVHIINYVGFDKGSSVGPMKELELGSSNAYSKSR